MKRLTASVVLLTFVALLGAFAQDLEGDEPQGEGVGPDVGLGITIGAQSFPNPDYDGTEATDKTITYQSVGLTPDIGIGKFGLGLDLTLNYRFDAEDDTGFEVRAADWVPDDETSFLELYLPKLRYVRWAQKGDPLYVLLGQVDNGLLGNGFIMGGYTNTQFLPDQRIFGMSLDVDGRLFDFPFAGVETFVGNLAVFDLIGSRLFVRPLAATALPIVRNLQLGGTVVSDRKPFHYVEDTLEDNPSASVSDFLPAGTSQSAAKALVWGIDFRMPVLNNDLVSLAGFGDYVNQGGNSGGMLGFGGRLFRVMTYGAQLRFLGEDFIPVYFDRSYDLFRHRKYAYYAGVDGFSTDSYVGWFASAGFSLLDDQLVFAANVDGPFGGADPDDTFKQPHLLATFMLGEGILGGFSMEASYDKKGIEDFADLVSPEDSVIGARVNYRIESAVISLVYDLQYDPFPEPGDDPWVITSKLETAISLF
ncbi:MAG: hypothetical protein ACOCW3_00065 [Spirochaetota bacterium]